MLRTISHIALLLALLGQSWAKPGLLDFFTGDECPKEITDGSCAIVYDDEDCEEGDWEPLRIKGDGLPKSFSTLTLNPLKALKNKRYKDDIESLIVRRGCNLEVFKDSDCTGDKYTFRAKNNEDLVVEELEDSDADDFGTFLEYLSV